MEGGHEQCIVQRVAQQLCVGAVQMYRKERFEQPQESPFWEGQPLKGWYQITTNKTGCPPLCQLEMTDRPLVLGVEDELVDAELLDARAPDGLLGR